MSSPPKVDIVPPPEPKGAKLKIQRVPAAAMPEETAILEPEKLDFTVAVPEPSISFAPQPPAEPKQRVVIIRRPASEAGEIPLMEEKSSEAAA